ncbi:hypothetical protein D915_002400 [Fasciola hepatica]|uniref:Centriolar and ciliogenesis-associated protein HYLS1 C-terminal domain-containing protein n=1 Tax=Fasciola hepatica TaxID=6192 RepID=A0A4E0RXE7_FASHE|nr:hypothetical protein D915_002400 [Fasciola hepatica]
MPLCSVGVPPFTADLDFSIEEIRNQLSALGVTDPSETQLIRLKRHLDGVIQRERNRLSVQYPSSAPIYEDQATNCSISDSSSTVSDGSCTILGITQGSAPSFPRDHPASPSYSQVWREPGPLKGTPFIPMKPGTMNSNHQSSETVFKSDHLLSTSPFQRPSHRSAVRTRQSQKAMTKLPTQTSLTMISSSSSSDEKNIDGNIKKTVCVPVAVPPSRLDKPATASENVSANRIGRQSNGNTPAMHRAFIDPANSTTVSHQTPQISRNDGDFEFVLSAKNDMCASKIPNSSAGDPNFRIHGSGFKSRMTQCPNLSVKGISSVSSTENSTTVPNTRTGSCGTTGSLTSQKPPLISVCTCSEMSCAGLQPNGSLSEGHVSEPIRHFKVILPSKEYKSRPALPTEAHVLYMPKGCDKEHKTSETDSQLRGAKFSSGEWKRNSSRSISARSQSVLRERRFVRSHSAQRYSRRRSSSSSRKLNIDARPERSALKHTSARPSRFAETTASSTIKDPIYTDDSEHSGPRSARFPENPVSKVHEWHSRLSTASIGHRSNFSQSSRSSVSVSRLRRQDPVSRYHSYHRTWLSHLAPGEDARRILRWNIKTAMMHREVPVLQRNLGEVTRLFGPHVAAMVARERQQNLKALNLDFIPGSERRRSRTRYHVRRSGSHR